MRREKGLTDEELDLIENVAAAERALIDDLTKKIGPLMDANPRAKTDLPTPAAKGYLARKMMKVVQKDRWKQKDLLIVSACSFMLALAMQNDDETKGVNDE